MDRTLSGATTPGESRPGSDGNEVIVCISQSCSITGILPSDCLVSYTGHSLGVVLPFCREAAGVFYSSSRLGKVLVCFLKQLISIYTLFTLSFCLNFRDKVSILKIAKSLVIYSQGATKIFPVELYKFQWIFIKKIISDIFL